MTNLLQLQNGSKSYGNKHLFNGAQFAINAGEHVGVIGPNGAGKTTLFRIITDQEHLDKGSVVKAKSLRLGYLAQHDDWRPNETVEEYLARDAIMPLWDLKALGQRLGLDNEIYHRPVMALSGGYRMRCKLLYLLGQEPNLMMLDEPTNYLDLETTLVLEEFLQGYRGAFLLISHDREFLRRTTDHILEIEQGDITKYNGNIEDYFEQKALLREQLEARALSLAEKRQEILNFVNRFGAKASKARQAQSRLKSLAKMETIEVKPLPVGAAIRIPAPPRTSKLILKLHQADLGYETKVILQAVNFALYTGDHIAVVGLNGAGKSTLLKVLAQVMPPLNGQLELGNQVSIGYYAQHVAENLDAQKTVLEEISAKAHPDTSRQDALNMAGSLLFSGADVEKKVGVLSGGEKSRVALGQILLQRAPLLILDEPTNHLDFQTVEALTQALEAYPGTVVVVSHDRGFIRRVGKHILEINQGQVTRYPGTYDEYVWSLQKGMLANTANTSAPVENAPADETIKSSSNANLRETKKQLERQLRQQERALAKFDDELARLTERISHLNEVIAGGETSAIEELAQCQRELESAEAGWLEISEEKEKTANTLSSLMA